MPYITLFIIKTKHALLHSKYATKIILMFFFFLGDRGIDGLNGLPGRSGLKGEPGS